MPWGAKLFHCQNVEEARDRACAHFGCPPGSVKVTMAQEPAGDEPGLALALWGDTPESLLAADNMDGRIAVDYREDGVWVEKYPSRGKGEALYRQDAEVYIRRKAIQGLEIAPLSLLLDRNIGMARVAGPQPAVVLPQDISVGVSADEMEAVCTLLPADPGGAPLDEEGVVQRLIERGVVFGHNRLAIRFMLSEQRYDKTYALAKGRRAVDGQNGKVTLHFRTTLTAAPKVIDERSGKVDFRSLDLFEPVAQEQLLASRSLATPGEAGLTVMGRELQAKPGKEAVLPRGKNVRYDETRMNMYAELAGMVQFSKGTVSVSNVYTIKGNCDMGVGNIDFDGNVQIQGGVITGMSVKASGNIIVAGVVEGATIEAGGDIVLSRGIQGMDRGRLIAGGDITAQFIERCEVTATGNVTADVVLHSRLAVAGTLRVQGRRGSLIGGNAQVARAVVAANLGSQAQTDTFIEVGVLPTTRARLEHLMRECSRLTVELDKLDKLATYLEKGGVLDEARTKLYNSIGESKFQNAQFFQEYSEEIERLTYEIEHAVDGRVHVLETAYPGVRLSIASGRYKVETEIPYATFYYRDGSISYIPCEAGRQ